MSEAVLIIGPSGSGKTSALRNADPKSSFLIQALRKSLPFRGWKEKWTEISESNRAGNLLVTDDPETIRKYIRGISDRRPEIKSIFIDDSQYIMANEFMRSALEKGYEKFTRIGQNFWLIITEASNLRPDLTVFFLHHSEVTDLGETKAKTIGKMLDDKITLEGMFTIVLRVAKRDDKHVFLTKNSGHDTVKAPEGMFTDAEIPNDINMVLDAIHSY
jgi:hypothetical protein